jgi:hypothetical protein
MCVLHSQKARVHINVPTILDNDEDLGPEISGEAMEVSQLDYVADESEDDTKEANSASTRQLAENNGPLPSKVHSKQLYSHQGSMHLYSKLTVKIDFGKLGVSSSTHIAKSHLTFSNSDLPKGVLKCWQGTYLPALYQVVRK